MEPRDECDFLLTNIRYVPPLPRNEDFTVVYPASAEGEPEAVTMTAALIAILKETCFTARMKTIIQGKEEEAKIWNIMWLRMSPASRCKVQEQPEYEAGNRRKDCVLLWELIRRTHLYINGEGDAVQMLNIKEEETRYEALKQGEREFLANFMIRFEAQVLASRGAGIPEITEAKRAMDFVYKLDKGRYGNMLADIRHSDMKLDPLAYSPTVIAAVRIATGWATDDPGSPGAGTDIHTAFGTSEDSDTKTKDGKPGKGKPDSGKSDAKKKNKSSVECFVCGKQGDCARDCRKKKASDKALVAKESSEGYDDEDEEFDEEEVTFVTLIERVLFSKHDVLLESQTRSTCSAIGTC